MVVSIPGKPNAKQAMFFSARERYVAYGGARGGGKSWALRRKLVTLALRYPGIKCLIVRRSYSELKSNHLYTMDEEYGSLFEYSDTDKAMRFRNGSVIFLGYCDSERDVLRYQGQEYDIIAIDEATQLTEFQFSIFKACLRGTKPFPRRMYLTCNPGGVGHAWVKRLFIDRRYNENEEESDYAFIPASVKDNSVLTEADPEYVRALESLPEMLRRAWLDGEWNVFEGQFFPEFNTATHVINVSEIPQDLTYFASADYGFDMFALLLCGISREGRIYVIGEYCEKNLTLGAAGDAAEEFLSGYDVKYLVISPDIFNRRQDTGKSGVEVFRGKRRLPPIKAADNRRVPGWRMVREQLAKGEDGDTNLKICSNARLLIRSLPFLICDPQRPEDCKDEPHEYTHAPEALRYALMSHISYEKNAEWKAAAAWNASSSSYTEKPWGAW